MTPYFGMVQTRVYPSAGATITTNLVDLGGSTGVVCVMNFVVPIEVIRWGVQVDDNELLDVGAGWNLRLLKYLIPGSATNAVTIDNLTTGTSDVAKGSLAYRNMVDGDTDVVTTEGDGSKTRAAPLPSKATRSLVPGQQLVFNLTDAADTSGMAQLWVQYVEGPLNPRAYTNMILY